MTTPASWKSVVSHYKTMPKEVQRYFGALPSLVKDYSWEVPLSYQFGRVELAHNMTLYCGVVKLHKVDATLARKAIEAQHITRDHFKDLFETIFGRKLRPAILKKLESASKARDKVLHGKAATPAELRKSVVDVLDYSSDFNSFVDKHAGFRPFGPLKGFKGRAKPLGKSTSRWVLRGVGFTEF